MKDIWIRPLGDERLIESGINEIILIHKISLS